MLGHTYEVLLLVVEELGDALVHVLDAVVDLLLLGADVVLAHVGDVALQFVVRVLAQLARATAPKWGRLRGARSRLSQGTPNASRNIAL